MILTTATTALRAESFHSPKIRGLFQTALLSTSALAVAIALTSAQADTRIKGNKTVVVDGNGTSGDKNSPWNVSGNLKVGGSGLFDGSGTSTVRNGGGTVSELTATSYIEIGSSGSDTLNILDGGAVANTDGLIGNISGSTGKVTVSGGESTQTQQRQDYRWRAGLHDRSWRRFDRTLRRSVGHRG